MAKHQKTVTRRRESERRKRLESVGIQAAGIAHEIKNPLTAIKAFADHLPARYDDPEFREKFCRIVNQEINRAKGIVTNILLFTAFPKPRRRRCDMARVLQEVVEILGNEIIAAGVAVDLDVKEQEIFADPEQLKQAFLNIIINALDAMRGKGGSLVIRTSVLDGGLEVVVEDTGCGIPKGKRRRIFDAFYTSKDSGTGLGLAVTQSIIDEHRGRIRVESKVGRGTRFKILLPRAGA